jgi:hypothetical protein
MYAELLSLPAVVYGCGTWSHTLREGGGCSSAQKDILAGEEGRYRRLETVQ